MLLSEIVGYHGSGHKMTTSTALKPPIFVAKNRGDARWFALDRSDAHGTGYIAKGDINPGKVLDASEDYTVLLKYADEAGIEYEDDPYFQCDEIAKHSSYEGSNVNDLVYIPSFVAAVKKAGYNSIYTSDTLTNDSIDAYILFDKSQFSIKDVEAVSIDD